MRLLFVCTHNRCRSILAEAITRQRAASRLSIASAGSEPAGVVHPLTLKYLKERGIPVDGLQSKSWESLDDDPVDIVVTVCDRAAGEACPLWLGPAEKVHWGLADPSAVQGDEAAQQQAFFHTIDMLEARIAKLLEFPLERETAAAIAGHMRTLGES